MPLEGRDEPAPLVRLERVVEEDMPAGPREASAGLERFGEGSEGVSDAEHQDEVGGGGAPGEIAHIGALEAAAIGDSRRGGARDRVVDEGLVEVAGVDRPAALREGDGVHALAAAQIERTPRRYRGGLDEFERGVDAAAEFVEAGEELGKKREEFGRGVEGSGDLGGRVATLISSPYTRHHS